MRVKVLYSLAVFCILTFSCSLAYAEEEEHDFSKIKQQPEIKALMVSKSLFTPNKWWQYEGINDDLPRAYAVEQYGRVSLGSRFTLGQGAFVSYRVLECQNAKLAHERFLSLCALNPAKNVRISWTKVPDGQEGRQYRRYTLNSSLKPVGMMEGAIMRYGRFVIAVTGRSNLRAFGPKPKIGERKWMCEPVYENVLQSVRAKWKGSKTILAEYEKKGGE